MASLYNIYISPKRDIKLEDIQKKMDLANDWFRFNINYWVIYTSSDAKKWHTRLRSLINDDHGSLFICKLDPSDYEGWESQIFWDWLNDKLAKIGKM